MNKRVPIVSTYEQVGEHCHVYLLDMYISKMPEKAKELDYFYLRSLEYMPSDPSAPWFYASPVGEHKLGGMVKDMFTDIGISGKTNHSLRTTGASILFQANVPEKIIQERTGHRSVKALRLHERTTGEQHQQVSHILSNQMQQRSIFTLQNQGSSAQGPTSRPPLPEFGMLQNCTINVNYGTSTINTQHQAPTYDKVDFPPEVERELSLIDI